MDRLSLLRGDCQLEAEQDKRREEFNTYVEDVFSKTELIAKLADGLRHIDKADIVGLMEEYAPVYWADIAQGWKDSLE